MADDWDDFDLVEAPVTVHSISFNSTGTRFAVAHSQGVEVFALFQKPAVPVDDSGSPKSSTTTTTAVPPIRPRSILKLGAAQLRPDAAAMVDRVATGSDDDWDISAAPGTAAAAALGSGGARKGEGVECGVGLAALLYETSVLAIVGGGQTPCHPPNRIVLFNGSYEQQRIDVLGPVARVVLRNRRVIALSQMYLTIHDFAGVTLFDGHAVGWAAAALLGAASVARMSKRAMASLLEGALGAVSTGAAGGTAAIPPPSPAPAASESGDVSAPPSAAPSRLRRMPMDVTNTEANPIVAYPDPVTGTVAISDWLSPRDDVLHRLPAHRGELDALALSGNGEALVTASETNTVLRVWNVATGTKLREVRLASAPRTTYIRSLNLFSSLGEGVSTSPSTFTPDIAACVDSKGEVKFFFVGGTGGDSTAGGDASAAGQAATAASGNSSSAALSGPDSAAAVGNQGSFFSSLRFVSSYFASEWHATSTTLPFLPTPDDAIKVGPSGTSPETVTPRDPPLSAGGGSKPQTGVTPSARVVPIDGAAVFEYGAFLSKYVGRPGDAADGTTGDGGSFGTKRAGPASTTEVTMLCVSERGNVVRIAFNPRGPSAAVADSLQLHW